MNMRQSGIIVAHALVGWALCFATIGVGRSVTSMQTTLIVHAILAPLFFVAISMFYFRKYHFTAPLQTAAIFIGIVVAMDFFVVALLILRSLGMFTSFLGTWLPFGLIFTATYLTGMFTTRGVRRVTVQP